MSKYIPVEAEKWAEMVQAMALAADLMVENKRLAAENERLRKAGDAMYHTAQQDGTGLWLHKSFQDWNAAKEGDSAK